MNTRTHYILAVGLLLLAALPLGCGSDDDNGGGGGGLKGDYEIFAGFVATPDLKDSATQEMTFVAFVERLNSADPSAKTAVVTVDGTTIPLVTSESTDAEATFRSTAIAYEPDAVYAVSVAIGGEAASSTITAPDYESVVTITAPTDGATFTPGQALAVAWSYTGTTPAKARLEVVGSTTTTDATLYEQVLNGTTQSASIPGTQTTTWNSYADVAVAVGVGVTQTWSGSLASEGSYSFVLLSTDEVTIHPEAGGPAGVYDIAAGFLMAAESGGYFMAVVNRINASDPSAMLATVTVNGTLVPMTPAPASDDTTAIFQSATLAYVPSTPYQIVVTLGGATATSSFTSPSYQCVLTLTSPPPMSTFTPGVDIQAAWTLTGTNPPAIRLIAGGDTSEPGDPGYVNEELPGTARSYTIDTSQWTGHSMAVVGVSVDESYSFAGTLASANSASYVNLTTDLVLLVAAGGGDDWYVSVHTHKGMLVPDGTDTTTVYARVENVLGNPCPDGSTVTFGVSGPGTLTATSAQTVNGWATTTLVAGTEEGTVTITAEAFGETDETTVAVSEGGVAEYYMLVTFPDLDPENPVLAPSGSTRVHVSLKTALEEQPCPNGTPITLRSQTLTGATDYFTFGNTTLNTVNGEAETTVTAGSTVPLGNVVFVYAETEAVEYDGGVGILAVMQ